jgi:hypothetical protein
MKSPRLSAPEAFVPEQTTSAAMAISGVMAVSDFQE